MLPPDQRLFESHLLLPEYRDGLAKNFGATSSVTTCPQVQHGPTSCSGWQPRGAKVLPITTMSR